MVSVPVLLSYYVLDKVEDTVTNDRRWEGDALVVRERLAARTAARLEAAADAPLDRPVSVVIPNWEQVDDLRLCLAALDGPDRAEGRLEVIVADNASSPPVVAELRAMAGAGRIALVENARNYGFTHAANQGIARARPGADVLLLNNDAILQGGAVAALQRAAYALPRAGMTVPRQILPPGTKTIRAHVPHAREEHPCDVNISAHHQNLGELPLFHDGGPVELTYAPFFAVYIRRDLLDDLGPLDAENGRHYRSDRAYCDLMRAATGRKLWYVPEAHVLHKLQQATDRMRDDEARASEFEIMFRQNRWDPDTARELGLRLARWDV